MKTTLAIILFTGAILVAHADPFSGSDNFNSSSVNTANWNTNPSFNGSPINDAQGSLNQTTGVLDYTANSGSGSDTQVWEWNVGTASITSNWTMQMDVSNQVISSAVTNSTAGIGIGVADTANLLSDNLTLKLDNAHGVQEFLSNSTIGGGQSNSFTSATSSTLATIQLAYNSSTQLIAVNYDATAGTNQFTTLYSFDPVSSWGLTSTDSMTFFIDASSDSIPVTSSNDVYGDNFAIQAAPEPSSVSFVLMGMTLLIVVTFVQRKYVKQVR